MAKKGTSVFRNPVDQSATKVSTLPDLTAYQAKWGGEGRPSPRTGTTGAGITKFGTQQLKYVDNDPSKGVVEIDTGANFRLGLQQTVASAGIDFGKATPFSQTYQQKRLGTITTYDQLATSPHAPQPPSGNPLDPTTWFTPKDKIPTQTQNNGQCVDDPMCGMKEFFEGVPAGTYCKCPNWFGWDDLDKHGCECDACKNGTGQCSDKVPKCDAWDLTCEGTGGLIKDPSSVWLWVKIILVLIGIGVLLWLLRPLFGIAKNITET